MHIHSAFPTSSNNLGVFLAASNSEITEAPTSWRSFSTLLCPWRLTELYYRDAQLVKSGADASTGFYDNNLAGTSAFVHSNLVLSLTLLVPKKKKKKREGKKQSPSTRLMWLKTSATAIVKC